MTKPGTDVAGLVERVARALIERASETGGSYRRTLGFVAIDVEEAARAAIAVVVEEAAKVASGWAATITTAENSLGHYRIAGRRIAAAILALTKGDRQP